MPRAAGRRAEAHAPHPLARLLGIVVVWNDVALRADNPWLLGCNAPIVASARTDAAWANAILKDYMSKQNPVFEHYEQRANLASWPPTLPIGCAANSERAMVSCASRRDSIAYVRYATAKAVGLTPVRLTNGDGQTPPPALDPADTWPSGCPAAVPKETTSHTGNLFGPFLDWSTFSMTHGKGYPLCGFGYVVTTITMAPGTTREQYDARTDHYELMWSSTSQEALKGYGYAPLPSPLIEIVRGTVAMQIDFD